MQGQKISSVFSLEQTAEDQHCSSYNKHPTMQVLRSYAELKGWAAAHSAPVVLTIGFFDGLHRGHRHLLEELFSLARHLSARSLVLTFDNAPRGFHSPEREWLYLTTAEEKLALLAETSTDATLLLTYDWSIASQNGLHFLKGLSLYVPLAGLVVGYDSRLGNDQIHGHEAYKELCQRLGIELSFVSALQDDALPIKSRLARDLVAAGDMPAVQNVLGYPYFVLGKVVRGKGKGGQKLQLPTANLLLPREKLAPPTGIYACLAEVQGSRYPAATCVMSAEQAHRTVLEREESIEVLPLDRRQVIVEAHLDGFCGNLYGKQLKLQFIQRMRDWIEFGSVEELRRQIVRDTEQAREAVGAFKSELEA